jgi:hypothetical protein
MAPKKKDKMAMLRTAEDIAMLNMTAQERKKLVAAALKKENAITESSRIDAEWGRSYTSRYIPGDAINEIKNGPVSSALRNGTQWGLFLRRNVTKGSEHMLSRRAHTASTSPMLAASASSGSLNGSSGSSSSSKRKPRFLGPVKGV